MSLIFTGEETREFSSGCRFLKAKNGNETVVVRISDEACEDYGLPECKAKAIEKYVAGNVEPAGRVRVSRSDFA